MSDASPLARRVAIVLLLVFVVAAGIWAGTNTIIGSDLWWAMATGRWIVQHGEFPHVDVFSYTHEGAPWFNQEWLTQLLFFEVFTHFGGNAVAGIKIAIVIGLFLLAAWIGWRRSGSLLWSALAVGAGALVCRTYLDVRPQLFTFVGTLSTIAITDAFRRGAKPWVLALLPIVFLLWVNLHFGFIFGLGALGLIAGCEILKSMLRLSGSLPLGRAKLLAGALVASGLVCFLNPQHAHAFTFPFTIMDSTTPWRQISEWYPTRLFVDEPFNPAIFGYVFVGGALVVALALAAAPRRIDPTDAALVVVTAVMAFQSRRFVPLYVLVSSPFVATCLSGVVDRLRRRPAGARELSSPRSALAAAALAVVGTASLGWRFEETVRPNFANGLFAGTIYTPFFPKDAVEFIRLNSPPPGRLYNLYNWGGFIEYWLPDVKVFIDGRAHTVYPPDFYVENITVQMAQPGWDSVLEKWKVAIILWPNPQREYAALPFALQSSAYWKAVYKDDVATVYAHVERGREWIEKAAADKLVLPDSPGPLVAKFNDLFAAQQFEKALALLQSILARFPTERPIYEANLTAATQRAQGSRQWADLVFVGVLAEGLGIKSAAFEAYSQALERGATGKAAAFCRVRRDALRP
jgi:hypothetical protein